MKSEQAEQLVIDNMNLVYFLINKYYPTFIHDEDLSQVGMIGLINAANTWDESKSKFSTYASNCILNEIKMELKKRVKQPQLLSLDYESRGDDCEIHKFSDTIAGEEDVDYVDYAGFCKKLKPQEIKIMDLRLAGYDQPEIAKMLGVPKPRVNFMLRQLKSKWRRYNGNN